MESRLSIKKERNTLWKIVAGKKIQLENSLRTSLRSLIKTSKKRLNKNLAAKKVRRKKIHVANSYRLDCLLAVAP